jgi:hypothetical protein
MVILIADCKEKTTVNEDSVGNFNIGAHNFKAELTGKNRILELYPTNER